MFNKSEASSAAPSGTKNTVTVISEGCHFKGEIVHLRGNFHVEGVVEGSIQSEFEVSVGPKGKIKGNVSAKTIQVGGLIEGQVNCGSMHIRPKGVFNGELSSDQLTIETGGFFDGTKSRRSDTNSAATKSVETEKKKA